MKKELGQHWLSDIDILRKIVGYADISESDQVLEIGPGMGTLTTELAKTGAEIICLEFDKDLIKNLTNKFKDNNNVEIIHGDIRKFDFNKLKQGYKVVANIPYYLTTNLIRNITDTNLKPSVCVLLVQKEVAERICAGPRKMSILSVIAQHNFQSELGVVVAPEFFTPPPKVNSQVVILKNPKDTSSIDNEKFYNLLKVGFSEKRKTLANSLNGKLNISKQEIEDALESIGLNKTVRAQELSLENWYTLFKDIHDLI